MPLHYFQKPKRQPLDQPDVHRDATIPAGFERRFRADEIDLDDLAIAIQRLLDDPSTALTKLRRVDLRLTPARVTHVSGAF